MKLIKNCAAQGDLLIRRIKEIPVGLKKMQPDKDGYIVAHSETGHHHVIEPKNGVCLYTGNDPLISYLTVIDEVETTLEHLRDFDKHEAYTITGGSYEIRRQREHIPEGWRQVVD